MLKIENLKKYYGKVKAVDNLSLELSEGEIFGFIGPNGAGKSTTIKCILNLTNKDSGRITIDEEEVSIYNYELNRIVGFLPSEVNLYGDMTVLEMLEYSNKFYIEDLSKRTEYLVNQLEVPVEKKINELSFGNLKKVGIVLALMHNPKLLILDEPTNGLDPLMQEAFFELLKEEKEKGVTIFLSSHNLSEVKKICDRVGIIKDGKLLKVDKIEDLNKNQPIIVSIRGSNSKKINLPVKDMNITKMNKDEIKFVYKGDINKLLKLISEVQIDHITIEEPTLEDIFMNYYKGE